MPAAAGGETSGKARERRRLWRVHRRFEQGQHRECGNLDRRLRRKRSDGHRREGGQRGHDGRVGGRRRRRARLAILDGRDGRGRGGNRLRSRRARSRRPARSPAEPSVQASRYRDAAGGAARAAARGRRDLTSRDDASTAGARLVARTCGLVFAAPGCAGRGVPGSRDQRSRSAAVPAPLFRLRPSPSAR